MTDLASIGVNHPAVPFPIKLNDDETKIIRTDTGEIAVLLSPGWGSGFVTENHSNKLTPFCPPAVLATLLNQKHLITPEALCEYYGGDPDEDYYSTYGVRDLTVVWITPGTCFDIDQYDGNESIVREHTPDWSA